MGSDYSKAAIDPTKSTTTEGDAKLVIPGLQSESVNCYEYENHVLFAIEISLAIKYSTNGEVKFSDGSNDLRLISINKLNLICQEKGFELKIPLKRIKKLENDSPIPMYSFKCQKCLPASEAFHVWLGRLEGIFKNYLIDTEKFRSYVKQSMKFFINDPSEFYMYAVNYDALVEMTREGDCLLAQTYIKVNNTFIEQLYLQFVSTINGVKDVRKFIYLYIICTVPEFAQFAHAQEMCHIRKFSPFPQLHCFLQLGQSGSCHGTPTSLTCIKIMAQFKKLLEQVKAKAVPNFQPNQLKKTIKTTTTQTYNREFVDNHVLEASLKQEIRNLTKNKHAVEERNTKLMEQNQKLKDSRKECQEEMEKLKQVVKDLRNVKDSTKTNEKLEKVIKNLELEMRNSNAEIRKLKGELKMRENHIKPAEKPKILDSPLNIEYYQRYIEEGRNLLVAASFELKEFISVCSTKEQRLRAVREMEDFKITMECLLKKAIRNLMILKVLRFPGGFPRHFQIDPNPDIDTLLKTTPFPMPFSKLTYSNMAKEEDCCICYDVVKQDDKIFECSDCTFECHYECFSKWEKYSSTCPQCRRLVVDHEESQ